MSGSQVPDRLLDLLVDRALVGLDPEDDTELGRMLVDFPDMGVVAREVELAGAAVALANLGPLFAPPEGLLAKIEMDSYDRMPTTVHRVPEVAASVKAARASVGPAPATRKSEGEAGAAAKVPSDFRQTVTSPGTREAAIPQTPNPRSNFSRTAAMPEALPPHALPQPQPQPPPSPSAPGQPTRPATSASFHAPTYGQQAGPAPYPVAPFTPRSSQGSIVGPHSTAPRRGGRGFAIAGWLAAAACFMLAVGAWYFRPRTRVVTVTVPAPVVETPSATPRPAPPSAVAEREALLSRAGTTRLEWAKTKDPAAKLVAGDVVWNNAEQRGYMRFHGLAKNDRRAAVYQLWIFDKRRDDKFPVDGGVFDVDEETGDVVVPIKATLFVEEVAMFAITIEKPGGVVVSKREHLVVTAKPAT